MIKPPLDWPSETASLQQDSYTWHDYSTNRVLDFHGDPVHAGLRILSDGNHHMALQAAIASFVQRHPDIGDVFYVTLPPHILNGIFTHGHIHLGNLKLPIEADVFIGPENILQSHYHHQRLSIPNAFARSLGQAWLMRKDQPQDISDLTRFCNGEIRFFISNPVSEKASFSVYHDTLMLLANEQQLDSHRLSQALTQGEDWVVHGTHVHHREAPQAIAAGKADMTLLYYHLALRYTRIFPQIFTMQPLHGSGHRGQSDYQPITEYAIARTHSDNHWANAFVEFMKQDHAMQCYREHGLAHIA